MNSTQSKLVTINVGGVIFKSTIKTLLRIGLLRGILCPTSDSTAIAWCNGNTITPENIIKCQTIISEEELNSLEVTDERIASLDFQFFDRSPKIFSEILDYSRNNLPVNSKIRKYSVYKNECDYWGYPWTLSGNSDFVVVLDEGIKKIHRICDVNAMTDSYIKSLIPDRPDQILFIYK